MFPFSHMLQYPLGFPRKDSGTLYIEHPMPAYFIIVRRLTITNVAHNKDPIKVYKKN